MTTTITSSGKAAKEVAATTKVPVQTGRGPCRVRRTTTSTTTSPGVQTLGRTMYTTASLQGKAEVVLTPLEKITPSILRRSQADRLRRSQSSRLNHPLAQLERIRLSPCSRSMRISPAIWRSRRARSSQLRRGPRTLRIGGQERLGIGRASSLGMFFDTKPRLNAD